MSQRSSQCDNAGGWFVAQVLVQGILLQLWAPLASAGGLYRRLRKALVDMEDLVSILRTPPALRDGSRELCQGVRSEIMPGT